MKGLSTRKSRFAKSTIVLDSNELLQKDVPPFKAATVIPRVLTKLAPPPPSGNGRSSGDRKNVGDSAKVKQPSRADNMKFLREFEKESDAAPDQISNGAKARSSASNGDAPHGKTSSRISAKDLDDDLSDDEFYVDEDWEEDESRRKVQKGAKGGQELSEAAKRFHVDVATVAPSDAALFQRRAEAILKGKSGTGVVPGAWVQSHDSLKK